MRILLHFTEIKQNKINWTPTRYQTINVLFNLLAIRPRLLPFIEIVKLATFFFKTVTFATLLFEIVKLDTSSKALSSLIFIQNCPVCHFFIGNCRVHYFFIQKKSSLLLSFETVKLPTFSFKRSEFTTLLFETVKLATLYSNLSCTLVIFCLKVVKNIQFTTSLFKKV